ncbi:MAG: Membrane-bound hydrogenase subunit ehaJ [Methanomicrobiales archaeon 53_19]|uniref:respiratory chain complex I subunit 1 family protein n=1 Tax=Methanocalculus sp. TaxID=2004547 RepID=UPI000749ABA1|nr:NADH-quinone oxidoreductase subunit H [Methanocalculus sp.]KUK71093.1 MAG: Membrane-bound hydrogenase subunit ehaJ [Methanocalculus sp. 52_23]KUL03947.1 MAG: Membrane-bound hydrogenase subunit ehaJ [Methanomicrobiales archaeon 53_19]HIJ06335.1 NADH-ubiquinone oxidoreductase [Methanocalculus sp.]
MIEYLLSAMILGLLLHGIHRKVIARVQGRPGPPIWQELLHTLKFLFKETWIPKTASQGLYVGVVALALAIWSAALILLLTGGSLLLLFALYLIHKIIEHGTGLSSGSQYSKFGAIRSVISAASELPLLASVALLYLFTGSLMISDIEAYQVINGPLLIPAFPAAIALYMVILSKIHYGPFSIIEAKELVSGYWTEHFGVWRGLLNAAFGLKTFVLLYTFVMVFIGPIGLPLTLLAILILMITLSFVCAVTPMLSPYDSVSIQTVTTGLIAIYIIYLGVFA